MHLIVSFEINIELVGNAITSPYKKNGLNVYLTAQNLLIHTSMLSVYKLLIGHHENEHTDINISLNRDVAAFLYNNIISYLLCTIIICLQ